MDGNGHSDEELFCIYRDCGDDEAFACVFRRTRPALLRLAGSLRVETSSIDDVVQVTYLVAMQKASIFDDSRSLVAWLAGILLREARRLRQERCRELEPSRLRAAGRRSRQSEDPRDRLCRRELWEAAAAAIRSLRVPYTAVLQMHVLCEMAPHEIAVQLSCSASTVRTQLARGLVLLRAKLGYTVRVGGGAMAAEVG